MQLRILLLCGLLSFFLPGIVFSQAIKMIAETGSFTDYELVNDELHILPSHSISIPSIANSSLFRIIEQSVVEVPVTYSPEEATRLFISSDSSQVIEKVNEGLYRGKKVSEIRIHRARYGKTGTLVTKYLKFRVYKAGNTNTLASTKKSKSIDHPLSLGTWYKIPVSKNAVYQLDADYLGDLGIPLSSIDPKRIQLWGTDGFPLPERVGDTRSSFSQIPILVEGEDDGSFDSSDRVIFYGNSPHRVNLNLGLYSHSLHPYSDQNYVFLTVGSENGIRIPTHNGNQNPNLTVTTFEDFIWKDEELTKPEGKFKSGRFWLGQKLEPAQSGFISVLKDTIAGFVSGSQVRVSARFYARSEQTTSYDVRVNNTDVTSRSVSRLISGYNESDGAAANPSTFNQSVSLTSDNGIIDVSVDVTHRDSGSEFFIDWIRINAERELLAQNDFLYFYTPSNSDPEEDTQYILKGFSSTPYAFDVTDPATPVLIPTITNGSDYSINYSRNSGRHIIAQNQPDVPGAGIEIENQNLSGISSYPTYVVVTSKELETEATELADYRKDQGLEPVVVLQQQIFNEFSGGIPDPVAIRDYVKFLWERANSDGQPVPEYLLLFGDTSYDTKGIIPNALTNHILSYQSAQSTDRILTFGTDDFFAYLDDEEGAFGGGTTSSSFLMDIGVGRIPVQTRSSAAVFIDKIKNYESQSSSGDWQNLFTYVADDDFPEPAKNRDIHVLNADVSAELMQVNEPGIRLKKIYTFSYPIEISGAGRQVPQATQDLINTVNNGTLVVNYSGHGNEQTLSDEELFLSEYVQNFTNTDKLCVLVTATCQFGRYDDTETQSGAEKFILAGNGGGIAALTTTRVVFTNSSVGNNNFGLNIVLSQKLSERIVSSPKRLGDIFKETKNGIIPGGTSTVGSSRNNKKFILLGDPATIFQLPSQKAELLSVNDSTTSSLSSSINIRALDEINLTGVIRNAQGDTDINFNGEASISIFDARRSVTLPERDWSCTLDDCQYSIEKDLLFKGKVLVTNGQFDLNTIIPKDISSSTENGRIVLFAEGENGTAGGSFTDITFSGINPDLPDDNTGPEMNIYLNDESFVNGNLINSSPTLVVELNDETGINTTGTGVGHEIIATIDTEPEQTIILNDFYEGNLNDFSGGRIEYPLDNLPEGSYSLKVRAWDVLNNPTEKEIFFEVAAEENLSVRNVFNYPNPMNNQTQFTFEHNQPGNPLEVSLRIYTLSGKPVHQIKEIIQNTSSYASISWNGRDRDNDRLGNGTYIYVLRVTAETIEGKQTTENTEKLVIIR